MSEPPAATFAPVFGNVLEMIGNTPMLELKRLDTGPCRLFVKMESMNPGNSIKDRIAVYMIDQAEKAGRLKPGGRIVEATAGNTGLALALIAAQKGYELTVVVPDKMSDEKISHLRAMGADVHLTRSDVAKGHPEYYQEVAAALAAAGEAAGVEVEEPPAGQVREVARKVWVGARRRDPDGHAVQGGADPAGSGGHLQLPGAVARLDFLPPIAPSSA